MRTLGLGRLAATLVAGLAVTVATAADVDDDAPRKQPAFKFGRTGRFGKPRPPEPKKPEPAKEVATRAPAAETHVGARREREFNAYLRRMDACDRLMDIAIASNNEDMQRRVEQLGERVWSIYQQNTGTPGAPQPDGDDVTLSKESSPGRPAKGSAGANGGRVKP